MSPEFDERIPAALLILRFFLGTFLLQWSIEKLILPGATALIAGNFYGVTLPLEGSYSLGIAKLILALALLVGFYRTIQLRPLAAHSYRVRGCKLGDPKSAPRCAFARRYPARWHGQGPRGAAARALSSLSPS